jgi:hypothetical protein
VVEKKLRRDTCGAVDRKSVREPRDEIVLSVRPIVGWRTEPCCWSPLRGVNDLRVGSGGCVLARRELIDGLLR